MEKEGRMSTDPIEFNARFLHPTAPAAAAEAGTPFLAHERAISPFQASL